jgi:Transglutaminase-like superfamily
LSFFLSSARASRQLRDQRFESIVASVQARRRGDRDSGRAFDLERARSLASVFDRLRLFYSQPYLCLFDSLALIHFLARFGLYPDWVFGVQADPFEAHCWVQAGSVVLNDTVERVSAFTPIMCV